MNNLLSIDKDKPFIHSHMHTILLSFCYNFFCFTLPFFFCLSVSAQICVSPGVLFDCNCWWWWTGWLVDSYIYYLLLPDCLLPSDNSVRYKPTIYLSLLRITLYPLSLFPHPINLQLQLDFISRETSSHSRTQASIHMPISQYGYYLLFFYQLVLFICTDGYFTNIPFIYLLLTFPFAICTIWDVFGSWPITGGQCWQWWRYAFSNDYS